MSTEPRARGVSLWLMPHGRVHADLAALIERIAHRLGISEQEETRCLELLSRTHQISLRRGRWVINKSLMVDTRADPERSLAVRAWWTQVALERIQAGHSEAFSFNLFSVSEADLARIREAYRAFFQQMRAIIADSAPNEKVVLFCSLMVPLEPAPDSHQ